ncbi:MAG: energy transducer TonB [Rudaea sp.]|nr:energy transducer TonB [Rudaea sp.]
MRLRMAIYAVTFMLSAMTPAFAQKGVPVLEMDADGEVQIAPDGHVSDYRLHSKLVPEVEALVDKNVRGWRFEPVLVDGTPVIAKTALHIRLKAQPKDGADDYLVQIVDVSFGNPQQGIDNRPPKYPDAAIRAGIGAKVLLSLRLDGAGKVADVQPYQTSLNRRAASEMEAEQWRRLFEKASVAAARTWHYDLSETVNGKPMAASVRVPIVYSLRGDGVHAPTSGEWTAYLPGPPHPAPWESTARVASAEELALVPEGHALALDSRFHLKDNVIGKTL